MQECVSLAVKILSQYAPRHSGFGGLVVSMLASGTQVRGLNSQHAFLRRGSKAINPMSQLCGM
jgi:hypothetical protein